jgi:hypothetical protein
MQEEELINKIIEKLSPYFFIYPEIIGEFEHWNQKRNVRLDLGLFPKDKTIEGGFPKYFFGIEVKCFDLNTDTAVYKTKNLIHQCLTYKYTKFGKKRMQPAFILIADNFNIDDGRKAFSAEANKFYTQQTIILKELAFRHNIGRLILRNDYVCFKLNDTFWSNTKGFKNKHLLNFYYGNFDVGNNAILPYEHDQ